MRGAPFLAPMLFADMGALGLVALWPVEDDMVGAPEGEQDDTAADMLE